MSAQSKSAAADKRRLKVEQLRKEQQAKERRRKFVTYGGSALGVLVIVGVIVAFVVAQPKSSPPTAGGGSAQIVPAASSGTTRVQQQKTTTATDTSGIPGVLAWDTTGWPGDGSVHQGALEHDHVDGPVTYEQLPPVGGPHNPIWMNAGVYTKPIPNERAVHNLEHGAVWITYNPDLPKADVATLTAFVTKQSMIAETEQTADQANRYMDLSPWATNDLPSPIVISAWGHQLRVSDAADPRLQKFVDTFRHTAKYTPELGAPVDGVPVQTGGRPALDGSRQPNPAGLAQ
jgi:hypothetical protein